MDGWRKTWLDTRTACLRCRGISITPSRRHTRMHATVLCYNRTAVPVHDAAFLDALSSCRCAVNSLSFLSFTSFFSDDGAILDLDSWPNSECERTVPYRFTHTRVLQDAREKKGPDRCPCILFPFYIRPRCIV